MSRLKNKVAVVTGGTSGIGLGTVKRLVAEGAVAYVFARRKEELEKMAASLGPNVATVSGDVRNLDDLDRLYATIVADGKKLDIVVPNVGAVDSVKLGDVPIDSFSHIITRRHADDSAREKSLERSK